MSQAEAVTSRCRPRNQGTEIAKNDRRPDSTNVLPWTAMATEDVHDSDIDLAQIRRLASVAELRQIIGDPLPLVCAKVAVSLNHLTRQFVKRSPFVCLATSDPDGNCDVTPRGDPPGFVRILDDRTLLLAERPGNRLADALRNIIANPHVGLLFIIPGVTDTFRVNGRAWITDDVDLLAPSTHDGRAPRLGVVIEIDEAFTQCSKAFIRSALWDPARFVGPEILPTNGEIMAVVAASFNAEHNPDFTAEAHDIARAERYSRGEGLY